LFCANLKITSQTRGDEVPDVVLRESKLFARVTLDCRGAQGAWIGLRGTRPFVFGGAARDTFGGIGFRALFGGLRFAV